MSSGEGWASFQMHSSRAKHAICATPVRLPRRPACLRQQVGVLLLQRVGRRLQLLLPLRQALGVPGEVLVGRPQAAALTRQVRVVGRQPCVDLCKRRGLALRQLALAARLLQLPLHVLRQGRGRGGQAGGAAECSTAACGVRQQVARGSCSHLPGVPCWCDKTAGPRGGIGAQPSHPARPTCSCRRSSDSFCLAACRSLLPLCCSARCTSSTAAPPSTTRNSIAHCRVGARRSPPAQAALSNCCCGEAWGFVCAFELCCAA